MLKRILNKITLEDNSNNNIIRVNPLGFKEENYLQDFLEAIKKDEEPNGTEGEK